MTSPVSFNAALLVLAVQCFGQLSGTGAISGKVLNSQSNAPIVKATVTLEFDGPPRATAIALTDSNGDYSFAGLPPGQYKLQGAKTGYRSLAYGTRSSGQAAVYIRLEDGANRPDLLIRLPLNSSISGVLSDSDGDPLVATDVAIYKLISRDGRSDVSQMGMTMSDDRGNFRFLLNDSGRFCLSANSNGFRNLNMLSGNGPLPLVTLPVVFPHACGEGRGRALELHAGERISGADFAVPSARASRPKGKVILPPDYDRSVPVQVLFRSASASIQSSFTGFRTGPNGEILSRPIAPGQYVVTATYDLAGVKQFGSIQAEFLSGEEKVFAIAPKPLLSLACKVIIEGPKPERFQQLPLVLESLKFPNLMQPRTTWQANRECRLNEVAPGSWKLNLTQLPGELYVKSVTLGSIDILRKDFELTGDPAEILTIVLSSAGAELSGEVEPTPDSELSSSVIVLAPAVDTLQSAALYRSQQTGPQRKFRFLAIPPGNYRIYAFEELDLNQWQSPGYLQRYSEMARELRAVDGEKPTVTLKRIPAN